MNSNGKKKNYIHYSLCASPVHLGKENSKLGIQKRKDKLYLECLQIGTLSPRLFSFKNLYKKRKKKVFLPRCLATELRYVHSKAQVGKTQGRGRGGEEERQRSTLTQFAVQHKKRGGRGNSKINNPNTVFAFFLN